MNAKGSVFVGDDKNIRHRFTVPLADNIVNDWIEKQSNLGFSLRVLIKAFVQSYGYQDATCLELGMPIRKRGRPPKQAKIRYDCMGDEINEIADDEITYNNEQESFEHAVHDEKQVSKPEMKAESNVESELDIDDLFNVSANQDSDIDTMQTDDDGFIDPESLLI